jgi:hypothetical protein
MELNTTFVILLCIGALLLASIAVLVDRLNFPQPPFRPKRIQPSDRHPTRDRTGAHIVEVTSAEAADDRLEP